MALNWDCSPAKSCYDLGRARYTTDGKTTTMKVVDDEAIGLTGRSGISSRPPHKVRFAWQQPSTAGDPLAELDAGSAQDVCSYPESAFGPPFAPPRYDKIKAI